MLLQAARRPTCRFPRCLSSWTRLTRRRSWNRSRCTRPSGMPERPPPSRERSQQMPGSRRAQGQPRLRAPVQAPAGLSPGRGLLQGSAGSLPTPADPAPRSILSLHPVHDAPLACPTHDPPRPCRLYSGCTVGPGETRASRSLTRRDRTDWPVLQHRGYPLCASPLLSGQSRCTSTAMKWHRLAGCKSGYPGRQADQSSIGRITPKR